MSRASLVLLLCAAGSLPAAAADANREQVFLDLVKERHLPPLDKTRWSQHVGKEAIWVGRGLAVARRTDVEGLQIDTGKQVEIREFEAHDYGDAAVLTYVIIEHHPQGAAQTTLRIRKLDTYLLREGRWQLAANAEVIGRPDRRAVTLETAALDRLAGTYETLLAGKPVLTKIWREGTHLYAQTQGQEKSELLPLSETLFFDAAEPQEGGPENVFEIGADGRATRWVYRDAGLEYPARRISD